MTLPFHLGLRDNRHMVSVVKEPGRTREVLGVAYPQQEQVARRAQILQYWAIDAQSPRDSALNTVNVPLETRAQSALYYQVNDATRALLNGTDMAPTGSRLDDRPGLKSRVHLGPGHASLPVESGRGGAFSAPGESLSSSPFARGRLGPRGPRG